MSLHKEFNEDNNNNNNKEEIKTPQKILHYNLVDSHVE